MVKVENCSLEELEMIVEVLASKDLQNEVKLELLKRKSSLVSFSQYEYKSGQIPNFKTENSDLCKMILSQLDISDLKFLCENFLNSKGNIGGYFFTEKYGVSKKSYGEFDNSNTFYALVELFNNEVMQRRYEETYNMVNYVINSVYRNIDFYSGELTKVVLLESLPVRNLLVQEKFVDVVEYLWHEREVVPGARICIGNFGLTRNRNKTAKQITFSQKALIEAVAFGCSYDELCNGNYEGAKKLIYVPKLKK